VDERPNDPRGRGTGQLIVSSKHVCLTMKPVITLGAVSHGRDNNLLLLRMLAASAVVYGHAFGYTRHTSSEPFYRLFGIGMGDIGVDVFFVVSGFLIAKSFVRKDLVSFAWARAMRIFPALWVSTVLLVLIVGVFFTPFSAPQFWLRHDTLTYITKNATMLPGIGCQIRLPFAFDSHSQEFNDSLWTLPYELQMYMLLALVGFCGLLRPVTAVALMLIGGVAFATGVLGLAHPMDVGRARFIFLFFSGTTFYLLRDYVPMRGGLALAGVLLCVAAGLATRNHALHRLVLAGMLPYAVLWFSFVPAGSIRRYNRLGDYSYGTYILAGPIQVWLGLRIHNCPPLVNLAGALLLVLPLAALSWHFLESRALSLELPRSLKPLAEFAASVRKQAETRLTRLRSRTRTGSTHPPNEA
jgi:peptidoglycan/LPS O-acetylase OafA/YrhL